MTTRTQLLGKAMNRAAEVDWEAVYTDMLPGVLNYFRYRVKDRTTVQDRIATMLEKASSGRARYRRDLASFQV